MSIEIKSGSLSDFFISAKETAKEIDEGRKVTKKNIIWVEPETLIFLLKPERTELVKFLREKKRIAFSELMQAMHRSSSSLDNDLEILSKYQLIKIFKEPNHKDGIYKIIETTYGNEKIEFRAEI